MNDSLQKKALRRQFSSIGWAMLIYLAVMNACVLAVAFFSAFQQVLTNAVSGGELDVDEIINSLMNNGWGYIAAIVIGFVVLLAWKGKDFCFHELWTREKKMRARDFLCLLCAVIACQLLFQIIVVVQETVLNWFGLSALNSLETATGTADSVSMFLYMALLAPIAEELLFRGLVVRTLLPYGKRFAILLSAFLFGVFHSNIVQTPYAFCVGLVLGYTAVEYSVFWAIVLHMFNNFVLADLMTRLTENLPENISEVIFWAVIIVASLGAVIAMIRCRREIVSYIRDNKVSDGMIRCFFTAPGIIVLTVILWASMVLMLFA